MANVFILSGREFVGNNEWGYGCDEISIYGVYSDIETAKEAFKNKVLETAQSLASLQDEFEYTDNNVFESVDPTEENYGWDYYISEFGGSWDVFLPQNDSFDYGFWFLPCVNLCKYELK